MTDANSLGATAQARQVKAPSAEALGRLWAHSGGKAWEPGSGLQHPSVLRLIEGGWVKVCTMRCGFEAFDTGLNWTDAARAYFELRATLSDPSEGDMK